MTLLIKNGHVLDPATETDEEIDIFIEDGKIVKPVNLITIAGNLFTLFETIQDVANDSMITYSGVECPSVFVKSLVVSGK